MQREKKTSFRDDESGWTQDCLDMACDLLGLNVVSVAKVLKFREMHVNRQGRISHIKCPRCGMKNGGMGRVGRHDLFFFFLGTNDKGRRVSWGSCLGDFWKVFFQHGPIVNDERINLENINCKRHCKSMRIIECFPWLCCSIRRGGICFFLSSFWLNCSVIIRHGNVKGRICCWLGWWLQTPDLFWDTCFFDGGSE